VPAGATVNTAVPETTARRARGDEWRVLGHLAGEAFQDDPVWQWVCPDPVLRRRHLGSAFAAIIRHRVKEGSSWTTTGLGGAAIWAPPGQWKTRNVDAARMVVPLLRVIGRNGVRERFTALSHIESHHPSEPHWYLELLATDNYLRGRGIGTTLMHPMIERCDAEGVPAYLESSKEENLPFYARFGFEVISDIRLADDAPPMWGMWRSPR
jgi:predicted GNAT family N-acyltransferase